MQPLKLVIPGNYYDSQIYEGRLYLWSIDDTLIHIYDWDKLIDSLKVTDFEILARECAFRNSSYLYGRQYERLFEDNDVKNLLMRKFNRLSDKKLHVSRSLLKRAEIASQDNPFPSPHSDTTIYRRKLYVGSSEGVDEANLRKNVKGNPISSRPQRIVDFSTSGIAASYQNLAISSGSDGLFMVRTDKFRGWNVEPELLSDGHSSTPNWTYWNVYSSSYIGRGYLVELEKAKYPQEDYSSQISGIKNVIDSREIFGKGNFSWSRHDKICQISKDEIVIFRHQPWEESFEEKYLRLGKIPIQEKTGHLVSIDSALFGFLIEYDEGIMVIQSDDSAYWIEGEPINWRVFPRSKHYENQLHILYEDRAEIFSFNHDYFVDQEKKLAGTRFSKRQNNAS